MSLRKAVLVDRDPALLDRLSVELARGGAAVETLSSTAGLTPDLLALSAPDWLVLDAGLPGMTRGALLVIARSLKSRLPLLRVMVVTEGECDAERDCPGATAIPRATLCAEGSAALGIVAAAVDVRAVIDGVLGRATPSALPRGERYEVAIDLFSDATFWVGKDKAVGVFVVTNVQPALGEQVSLAVTLMGRKTLELKGEVAWLRTRRSFGLKQPPGVGVKLVGSGEEQRLAIDRFLEQREPLMWIG
ncbi:MAG TPA: hypothetical protein VGK67_29860 [Myxococcales bacterium]